MDWRRYTQPTERQVRQSSAEAKREAAVRDRKDLAGVAYMGKNE